MKATNKSKEIIGYALSATSLLNGKKAVCRNADGSTPVIKGLGGSKRDERFINIITDEPNITSHIDILSDNFTLEFDISNVAEEIDKIVLLGFDGSAEYSIRDFDLYFSDESSAFEGDPVYSYHCDTAFTPKTRSTCDVMISLDEPIKGKKLGFRFLKPNPTDSVARIAFIGAYSQRYELTHGILKAKTGKNVLKTYEIDLPTDYAEVLTDNEAFGGNYITLDNNSVDFLCRAHLNGGVFYAAYSGEGKLLLNGAEPQTEQVADNCFIAKWDIAENKPYSLAVKGKIRLSEIGVYDSATEITVTDTVLSNDFYGIGACVLPMAFMDRSAAEGYNEAYWQKEKSRTNLCRPTVVRLWFQPDWFIIDEAAYYRHEYDFNSERMQGVYKYLDLYRESGVEVEMNYGWKVAPENQGWFSIQDVRAKAESAPADLDEFAYSCAEFMYELIVNRGYTNIKYLSFYNEPCTRDVETPNWIGDFLVIPPLDKPTPNGEFAREKLYYWHEMAAKAKAAICRKGIGDRLQIWGAECAGTDEMLAAWLNAFDRSGDSLIDMYTIHTYYNNETGIDKMGAALKKAGSIPVCATEFAASAAGKQWGLSNIQMAMSFIKNGFCGAFLWLLSGITLAAPAAFSIDSDDNNMWRSPHIKPRGVNSIFYELCLFMRYVPVHSKSFEVAVPPSKTVPCFDTKSLEWSKRYESNMRAAAFKLPNGEYAVFVEADKTGYEKAVKINIPVNDGTVFYKMSVGDENDLTAPARLPECCGTVTAKSGAFTDRLESGHTLTLYTTVKPYEQIICTKDIVELTAGGEYEISYSLYDTNESRVSFAVSSGENVITLNGNTVKVLENAAVGSMASVKLTLENGKNTYDTLLIKVV